MYPLTTLSQTKGVHPWPLKRNLDPWDNMVHIMPQVLLGAFNAGAVYRHTCKHLCERWVNQPNPEPPTADMEISCKVKTHVHAPIQPNVHHPPAGVQPEPAANQCTNPSTQHQCTPAKPTQQVVKTPQHNQSAVQSSTEQKVLAPPSAPATKVPASPSSYTSLATCWSSHTHHVPQHLIEQM